MKKVTGVLSVMCGLLGFVISIPFDRVHFNYFLAVIVTAILGGLLGVFFVLRTFNDRGVKWRSLHTGEKIGAIALGIIAFTQFSLSVIIFYRLGVLASRGYQMNMLALGCSLLLLLTGGGGLIYIRLTFTKKQEDPLRHDLLDDSEIKKKR
jgi:H+/Cl- antiporter ClcA